MVTVLKRVFGHKVRIGGTPHSGWTPEGAISLLPMPIRDVIFNLEIQFDGFGYFLIYESQDGDLCGDTWHETLSDAEAAAESFGVESEQWQIAQSQD